MSADLLRTRLADDFDRTANEQAEILVSGSRMPLDGMRHAQGIIEGLRIAKNLLEDRYRNLHAIG